MFPYDPVRNARESGFENVPDYLLTETDTVGSTDTPDLEEISRRGEWVKTLRAHPWVLILAAVVVLWFLRKPGRGLL